MRIKITNYLDAISSWCFWAAPAWQELQRRYANRVAFEWKIALMDESGFPKSRAQMDWFYRRSGMLMRSPVMLKSAWHTLKIFEYLPPNALAQAAKELGVKDDRVWLAMARAGLLEGKSTGEWDVALAIAAKASGLPNEQLLKLARSPEIEAKLRATTKEFHALQVTQRPTFLIESEIGDRAIFSGFAKLEPIAATIDAMLDDLAGYDAHAAHFGTPPD